MVQDFFLFVSICLGGAEGVVLLFLGVDIEFLPGKGGSVWPLIFLLPQGVSVDGFILNTEVHTAGLTWQMLAKFPQKHRNPANTDSLSERLSSASNHVKVKHMIIVLAAGWDNANPGFCQNTSQHNREKLPQAGGPYPHISEYKCSNPTVSPVAVSRPNCLCLWFI